MISVSASIGWIIFNFFSLVKGFLFLFATKSLAEAMLFSIRNKLLSGSFLETFNLSSPVSFVETISIFLPGFWQIMQRSLI